MRPGHLTLPRPGSEIVTFAENIYEQVCQNRRCRVPQFFYICENLNGGCHHPSPVMSVILRLLSPVKFKMDVVGML